ncbi:MAG: restriction endonuclease subunit M [Patescibacteria group bacterium]
MVATSYDIDIKESTLRRQGCLLDILLTDHTTKKNIIWATDSYGQYGRAFAPDKQIKPELVTGMYRLLIQPRAAKSLEEQRHRTKEKAEVFTPLKTIEQMNKALESSQPNKKNWQEYVRELKLEITCGEAPFIVTRYNPTAHGALISISGRVGFLDRKLKVVSRYCDNKKDWLNWAREAFKASYGYEWQGDNVLIARENLLYTLIDYYETKFSQKPSLKVQEEFAEIISWNIIQMDGLRYVVPMTCFHEVEAIPGQFKLFGEQTEELDKIEEYECEGCIYNRMHKHNGIYSKIIDWKINKVIRFVDLIK